MVNQVLCACVWCLQESGGQGRSVSRATRTRHLAKQKKTWPNQTDLPVLQRRFSTLSTPSLVKTTAALSTPSQTNISTLSEMRQYVYNNDIETYHSMILSNNENDQIGMLGDEREEDNQIEMLEEEEEEDDQIEVLEDDQIETLEDEWEEDDQIEMLEDEGEEDEEENNERDQIGMLEREEEEYTGESENFGKLMIKVHITL